jgi:DNA-binding GntR family transcriptional regulator
MPTAPTVSAARRRPVPALDLPPREPAESGRAWAFRALRQNILHLHLRPGQAVSETEIAAAFRLSRTPVREAFIRLAGEGLLDVHPQKGTLVSRIDSGRADEARFLRRVVETAILREAARDFPAPLRFELAANLEMQRFCRKERSFERMFHLDNEFHRLLYRGCGKESLWSHIKKFDGDLDRLRVLRLATRISWDGVIEEHARILRLVGSGKPDGAEDLVGEHLTASLYDTLAARYPDYFRS